MEAQPWWGSQTSRRLEPRCVCILANAGHSPTLLILGVCVATSHWGVICVFLMTKSHKFSCLFPCVFCQVSLLGFPPPTFLLCCPFWSSLHFRILWIRVRCWACGP